MAATQSTTDITRAVNLRINTDLRALIDRAAQATHKSRTEFMLEAARAAAINALLDQAYVSLNESDWDTFQQALDAPPNPSPALRRLMQTPPPWQE